MDINKLNTIITHLKSYSIELFGNTNIKTFENGINNHSQIFFYKNHILITTVGANMSPIIEIRSLSLNDKSDIEIALSIATIIKIDNILFYLFYFHKIKFDLNIKSNHMEIFVRPSNKEIFSRLSFTENDISIELRENKKMNEITKITLPFGLSNLNLDSEYFKDLVGEIAKIVESNSC